MDPRAELAQQLLEYQRFKQAAENLQAMDSRRNLIWTRENVPEEFAGEELLRSTVRPARRFRQLLVGRLGEEARTPAEAGQRLGGGEDRLAHRPAGAQRASIDLLPLLADLPTRLDRIATFLAVLEMIRLPARSSRSSASCSARSGSRRVAGSSRGRRLDPGGGRGGTGRGGPMVSRQRAHGLRKPSCSSRAVGAVIFASDGAGRPEGDRRGVRAGLDERGGARRRSTAWRRPRRRSDSGLRLERVAGGYRLATRPEVGAWVRQFMRQRNRTRLSPPRWRRWPSWPTGSR